VIGPGGVFNIGMSSLRFRSALLLPISLLVMTGITRAQTDSNSSTSIDPLALKVLKAVTDPIESSKSFNFRALVAEDHLGTNGQVITQFRVEDVTVSRPDKLHVEIKRPNQRLAFYLNAGSATLYSPEKKLYTTVAAPKTIDLALDKLQEKDISFVFSNLLQSDPLKSLTVGLKSAYVIGRTTIADVQVHQLAFSGQNADWQLWVTGGEEPRMIRAEIIDKTETPQLRTTVTFLGWNLNTNPSPATFEFQKPTDAKAIALAQQSASTSTPEPKQ
jgi:hypothetical protein